ncbi:FecR domain-containing protein [Caulobacter segnis]|uniref:FecR family protein n=1 Tax=Caulobacter segnis TaxID=88688 RepID=UPI00240F97D1|nr:FecR domain-containing protein [Caulobacter segnis]MDG2523737.1 FecR domain-containing protein [Caulobacter segnis]
MNDNRSSHGTPAEPDAAGWFVLLQRDPHDESLRSRFDAWLNASYDNQAEWTRVSLSWETLGLMRDDPQVLRAREALKADIKERSAMPFRWAAAVAAIVVAGGVALFTGLTLKAPQHNTVAAVRDVAVYRTAVGDQRIVTLADGSRATLSTDTELRVTSWGAKRALTLVKGEAFFEVAKDPSHPFVVTAAGRTVTALGTAFNVRLASDHWSVALLEGKVRVASLNSATTTDLLPGAQLVQYGSKDWAVNRVDVQRVSAWRSGDVIFDDQPLGSIVAEMNRYSNRKIRLGDADLAQTPLSGRFKTGDTAGFVATLEAYGVAKVEQSGPAQIDLVSPSRD